MYYVKYISEDCIQFAVISICVAFMFAVFPTLLLILYPTSIFCSTSPVVDLGDSMHYTLSWKDFRDRKRMEPMVDETSE